MYGLLRRRRGAIAFAGTGRGIIERSLVRSLAMAGASVARTYGVGKKRSLQRGAHKGPRGIWQIGSTGGRVGQHVAFAHALPAQLFFIFRFDRVECEVLPAMLRLELRKSKPILQPSSDLCCELSVSKSCPCAFLSAAYLPC